VEIKNRKSVAILLYRPKLLTVGGLKLVREIRGKK
jgi:hypothetical protein